MPDSQLESQVERAVEKLRAYEFPGYGQQLRKDVEVVCAAASLAVLMRRTKRDDRLTIDKTIHGWRVEIQGHQRQGRSPNCDSFEEALTTALSVVEENENE